MIALSETDARTLDGADLYDYYFHWGKQGGSLWPLYNHHSPSPNALHQNHVSDGIMSVVAVRRIEPGEEIFVRYDTGTGGDTWQTRSETRRSVQPYASTVAQPRRRRVQSLSASASITMAQVISTYAII